MVQSNCTQCFHYKLNNSTGHLKQMNERRFFIQRKRVFAVRAGRQATTLREASKRRTHFFWNKLSNLNDGLTTERIDGVNFRWHALQNMDIRVVQCREISYNPFLACVRIHSIPNENLRRSVGTATIDMTFVCIWNTYFLAQLPRNCSNWWNQESALQRPDFLASD